VNKRKSSNTNNTHFIYNLSATLEPFLMLQCTIPILFHDLTHQQHNSVSVHPHYIIRGRNTLNHFLIIPNYTATIPLHHLCLPKSPPFHNTIPSTPFPISHHNSLLPADLFKPWQGVSKSTTEYNLHNRLCGRKILFSPEPPSPSLAEN